jgi:hypothetical protein
MNSKEQLQTQLVDLNLDIDEAKLYVELLVAPNTHLQLARATGINRTKVYRLIENLEKRSLVSRRTDDRGTFLIANDPSVLEMDLVYQEEQMHRRRDAFDRLVDGVRDLDGAGPGFAVQTYEGVEGFKQMQWHELRCKNEVLVLGSMTVEQLGISHRWAEKFRARTVDEGYRVRELFNRSDHISGFTRNEAFLDLYEARLMPVENLPLPDGTPMVVYNSTVAVYQFKDDRRVGVEIINAAYAQTMRHIFEYYWTHGRPLENHSNTP